MKLFADSHGDRRRRSSASGQAVSMERFSSNVGSSFTEDTARRSDDSVNHRIAAFAPQSSGSVRKYRSGTHQIATMTFNNQDTVLMRAETDIHVCFLHDNRIYIFKKIPSAGDESNFIVKNPNSPFDEGVEDGPAEAPHVETLVRELILHMVTSPKYRLLNSMYVVFSTLDSFIFLSIVVATIVGFATVQTEGNSITTVTAYSIPITIIIVLEIFFGILLNTTHFWILRRVSIYIVLLFYLLYYGAIALLGSAAGYSTNHTVFLYVLLAIRFFAFALETIVDVAIDLSIHNDLILINTPLENTGMQRYGWGSLKNYLDVRHCMSVFPEVPTDRCYVGSLNSWLPFSIQYTTEGFLLEHITDSKTSFSFLYVYGGCLIQIFVSLAFAAMLGTIVFIAVMAVIFVGLFTDVLLGRRYKGGFTNFLKEIVYHF